MKTVSRYLSILWVVSFLLINPQIDAFAYDVIHGVEYNDVVDVTFVRFIDYQFSIRYGDDGPFRITINENLYNKNFIDELVGMKLKESNPYITWTVTQENGTITRYEYFNTTIFAIVTDSTPEMGSVGRGFLITFAVIAGIGGGIGLIYVVNKLRHRLALKNCTSCSNHATSKCSKCGKFFCANCATKGCSGCGSRKFIRL